MLVKQASQQNAKKQKRRPNFSVSDRAEIGQYADILTNTNTHPGKKTASDEQWNLFCHLHCCYTTQGRKHPLPLLLLKPTFIGRRQMCPLTTPTKSHPHKFNYCDLSFAMPSALAKFAIVKFTQNIIALQYISGQGYLEKHLLGKANSNSWIGREVSQLEAPLS